MENSNHIDHVDDPERCQGIVASGQCHLRRVEGSDKCLMHGGNRAAINLKERAERSYIAALWRAEVQQFSDDSKIKDLTVEIGVARLLLHRMLESCRTSNELLLRSTSISDLVLKVTKVVEACDRIDMRMGLLLDRTQLVSFGQRIVDLVSNYISDPDILSKFANALVEEIKKTGDDPLASRANPNFSNPVLRNRG